MISSILRLDAVRGGDTAIAGGKGAHLGELAARGFPVPPGFVVSAQAYRDVFDATALARDVGELEHAPAGETAGRCARVRRRIVEAEIPVSLETSIRAAHRDLVAARDAHVFCAVRSSATAEDQAGASFAGQHGTYYYVDAARLVEMIKRCWASLWNAEAAAYRSAHGIPQPSVAMAVVVQEMVRSEVSGVAFTANPITGSRDEIAIEASWGMGAALVDGRVTPDRYLVSRDDFSVRERRIADKRFMVPADLAAGSDARLIEVPHDLRRRETLHDDQVAAVARCAAACEAHFGAPQDVEWTIAEGRVHLLQSRPITAIGSVPIGHGMQGRYVLFKAVAENFTDPLTPLMVDLFATTCEPFLRVIGGRLYTDLKYARPLVPCKISDEELAELMYSMLPSGPRTLSVSLAKLPAALLAGAVTWLVNGVTFARTRHMPDDFMESFRALCRDVDDDPALGPVEALRRLAFRPRLLEPVGRMPIMINVTCLRFAPWMSALRAMVRRWAPALPPESAALLCAGTPGVLSTAMGRAIETLAADAKRVPAVAELLTVSATGDIVGRLRREPAAHAFLEKLDAFLAVHGHRALKEFEIRAPRWFEDPSPVLALIRNFLVAGSDQAARGDRAADARVDAEQRVLAALAARPFERMFGWRARLVRLAAGRTRYFLKLRENSRFYHIMAIGVTRRKVLQLEAALLRQGTLKCRDDIFFLRWREIAALRDGRKAWLDVEDRIRERRMEYVRLAKLTPPRTIGIESTRPEVAESAGDRFEGQSASPGWYEGVARVILDPALDAVLHPGEVLVAPYTDPAWTPLFLTAGAAVVEVGSYLSHAGTIAREYGMPCVVDVADCTQRIRTGMRVHVDGNRGRVRIIAGGGAA